MIRRTLNAFLLFWAANLQAAFAQTCPLCKLSLMNSPEGRHIAKAFNSGILFLLAMPYLIAAGIALTIFLLRRRRKKSENIDILITKRAGTTKACLRGASEQVKSAFRRATDSLRRSSRSVQSELE